MANLVFIGALLLCWFVTFRWAQGLSKKHEDPPILLQGLPDLPPIVLPSLSGEKAEKKKAEETEEESEEEDVGDSDDEFREDKYGEHAKRDQLMFASPPIAACPVKPTTTNFRVQDIPMFTPRDELFPKPS